MFFCTGHSIHTLSDCIEPATKHDHLHGPFERRKCNTCGLPKVSVQHVNIAAMPILISYRLKSDPRTVAIKWRASPAGEIFVVKEAFPLRLATVFFTLCADAAASANNRIILITGGNYHAIRNLFMWILRWAHGDKALPMISEKPFLNMFRLRQAAHIAGAQSLIEVIDAHVKVLTNSLPKSDDIEAVYKEFSANHPARGVLVHSIATAIVAGRAKVDDTRMGELCKRREDLLGDINAALPETYARKEEYDANIEKCRAHAVEKQNAEARARDEVKAQQLKGQIQKSVYEIRKLDRIKKERDEAVMEEQNALRRQEYERRRKQNLDLISAC